MNELTTPKKPDDFASIRAFWKGFGIGAALGLVVGLIYAARGEPVWAVPITALFVGALGGICGRIWFAVKAAMELFRRE